MNSRKQSFAALGILAVALGVTALTACGKQEDPYEKAQSAYAAGDYQTAAAQFKLAAENGNADAMYSLAVLYYDGTGVEQNYAEAVKYFRMAADKGDVNAMCDLGNCYYSGNGVEKDLTEYKKWIQKAAENGSVNAMRDLGVLYSNAGNRAESMKWYRMAADKGNVNAMESLGIHSWWNWNEHGMEKDIKDAVKWYRTAADKGNADAMLSLGSCYYHGIGVKKDLNEAVNWYRKAVDGGNSDAQKTLDSLTKEMSDIKQYREAADKGDVEAMRSLGVCCHGGYGTEKDDAEALEWFEKAADGGDQLARKYCELLTEEMNREKKEADRRMELAKWFLETVENGDAEAIFAFGGDQGASDAKEYLAEEVKWFEDAVNKESAKLKDPECVRYFDFLSITKEYWEAAEKGDAEAVFKLASGYENARKGYWVEWYRKTAEKGNTKAMMRLAEFYLNGMDVERNEEAAAKWFLKAAESGDADAMCALAYDYYAQRFGVKLDPKEAVKWYRKAIEKGNTKAMRRLALCYYYGSGVEKSREEADKWFRKSVESIREKAENGDAEAMRSLGMEFFEAYMFEEQYDKEAAEWFRKAAENGNSRAMLDIGLCYEFGVGVEKNEEEASKWIERYKEKWNIGIIPSRPVSQDDSMLRLEKALFLNKSLIQDLAGKPAENAE